MEPDTNNHSVFMLHYHLFMCIKYRNEVIDDTISNRLKEIFVKIAPAYNITLEEWNHDVDHVHILFRGQPNTEISKFINAYKSASSRIIKKEFPEIRKISLERDVLVTKLLSVDHSQSYRRHYQAIHSIAG